MKKIHFSIVFIIILTLALPDSANKSMSVKGHMQENGHYVNAHRRTTPDSLSYNNYSAKGNTNPTNNKKGTKKRYKHKIKKLKKTQRKEKIIISDSGRRKEKGQGQKGEKSCRKEPT